MFKKILLSGVKPTGYSHIGNYFGAMKQFVDLQDEYKAHIFIADLHALTSVQNKVSLEEYTGRILLNYLAIGLDPDKVIIYKQSDVPQVTELAWIFNCITTMPYLKRAHAYKDAIANGKDANVGLFNYPILMAADILIQDADVVPVGQDQKQHLEITRDIAQKFNNTFGEIFKLPESYILKDAAIVPGTDGRKMSKSYNNTIMLFGPNEYNREAVMGIVTDSEGGVPKNVYNIHKLFREEAELSKLYDENKGNYKLLKEKLIEDIENFNKPLQEKRNYWRNNKNKLKEILDKGATIANERAEEKMKRVRELVGLNFSLK